MRRFRRIPLAALLTAALTITGCATVVDGTGAPRFVADVAGLDAERMTAADLRARGPERLAGLVETYYPSQFGVRESEPPSITSAAKAGPASGALSDNDRASTARRLGDTATSPECPALYHWVL